MCPTSKEKKRPLVVPDQVVTARKMALNIGLIRVSMFPGIVGMDVARDINRAVTELGAVEYATAAPTCPQFRSPITRWR